MEYEPLVRCAPIAGSSAGMIKTTRRHIWAQGGRPTPSVAPPMPRESSWRKCKCDRIMMSFRSGQTIYEVISHNQGLPTTATS